ncbi:M20/M25/M40 family metallo-hydrolase [Agathobaculum sp. Marseille-P7918]|uniref:M20/M25/M40 family metallo-hydrolase n=1 Tax=Agathobaculum sp. Marseille-P7918 TaxID=2479843 RepID=UPI0013DE608F|nr:M20/M25/M40 family metallo-hydrolase [Agathobaculum sp. Marseille-P7918]
MELLEEIKALTEKLVAIPSVNGTPGERAIADAIEAYLRDIPYFQAHPELVITQELKDDPLHRHNVMALLKGGDGTERDCIMLHGHIDTVDVDDYGKYKPYAFDCAKLAEVLQSAELPEEVRRDLASGDYLFGRGACDMKGGDAVFLVLVCHLAQAPEKLHGNLLLSFNPVEETLHRGIIEELPLLQKIQQEHDLHFRLAINNDFICPMYAGDTTRYVYTGAVGKLLPMFYIIGRETHVAQCFEGFSPDLTAAELVRLIDRNPDFCDGYQGEYTLPPTVLKMQDLKPSYNVQTPHTACVYFNYFVHNRQVTESMELFKSAARTALDNVMQQADARYKTYCTLSGNRYSSLLEQTQVLDYRELCDRARAVYQGDLDAFIDRTADDSIAAGDDMRITSLRIVQALCELCGIKTPTVVVFLATPFCPHNTLKREVPEEARVYAEVEQIAAEFSAESGEQMKLQQFFPSLTDSSYLKIDDDADSIAMLQACFPGYEKLYPVPLATAKALNIPAVNYGVWGKDCHKWTERIYMPYSFGQLPKFILKTIQYYFA